MVTILDREDPDPEMNRAGRDDLGRFVRNDTTVEQAMKEIHSVLKVLLKRNHTALSMVERSKTGQSMRRLDYLISIIDSGTRQASPESADRDPWED